MRLDATAGSAAANCYLTRAQANVWMVKRLHTTLWDDTEEADKDRALMWATRILDHYRWVGAKATGIQALAWPRRYVENPDNAFAELSPATIPLVIQEATVEMAFFLLQEDRTADPVGIGFDNMQIGSLSLTPSSDNIRKVIPKSIMDIISPYLVNAPYSIGHILERA